MTKIETGSYFELPSGDVVRVSRILSVEFSIENSRIESVEVQFNDENGGCWTVWTEFHDESQTYTIEAV